jgi:hypothetical protein
MLYCAVQCDAISGLIAVLEAQWFRRNRSAACEKFYFVRVVLSPESQKTDAKNSSIKPERYDLGDKGNLTKLV